MLSSADLDVIARDPELPGLRIALDAEAAADALRAIYPSTRIHTLRPTYLRYKPGASCLAGFEAHTDAGSTFAAIRALPRDRWDERAGDAEAAVPALLSPGVAEIPEHCLKIYIFPNDPELSGARRLMVPEMRGEIISRFARKRPELLHAPLHVLRYKPERRLVVRLGGEDGMLLKCYTADDFTRAHTNATAFHSASKLSIPRLRGAGRKRGTLAWNWIPGTTLHDRRAQLEPDLLRKVGAALAALHRQPPPPHTLYQPCMVATLVAAVAADLAVVLPDRSAAAAELAAELVPQMAAIDVTPAALHGDLAPEHILLPASGKVTLIDFDRAGAGHPAYDFATLFAKLMVRPAAAAPESLLNPLLEGYVTAGGRPCADAMPAFTAAALLLLSTQPFRHRAPDWPQQTHRILAMAQGALRNAGIAA